MGKPVRIGCASGFWGDSSVAAPQLVHSGEIDYLVFDYLAEITLSIMARMRAKDPAQGYATDFVSVVMKRLVKEIARKRIKVISNAGGLNPAACAAATRAIIAEAGLDLKVACVHGDDLWSEIDRLRGELQSPVPLPEKFASVNAYLGAVPIAEALGQGADIVIVGRCVDSAVALGPLLYEFGWAVDDYDRLAAGSLAGHIIECGAQATGGLFTDWAEVPDWDNIGYPIVTVEPSGVFTVSKPSGTGGIVTRGTIAEQLVYEIGDPAAYQLPDVVCDFTAVQIQEVGENLVRVSGARGYAPTGLYKISATYQDGWRAVAHLTIGGIDAVAKAQRTAEAILKRTRRIFASLNLGEYRDTLVEVLGAEASYGPHARREARESREVVMKLGVSHAEKMALDIFSREIAPAGTSFSPGTTGYFGGVPKPQPIIRLFSGFLPKRAIRITVEIDGKSRPVSIETEPHPQERLPPVPTAIEALPPGPRNRVPLIRLAFARSGDKGNDSNIGVIARRPEYLAAIREQLTAEAVGRYMAHVVEGKVERFDLPGIHGLNFLLRDALGGGGIASLRNDPQGKAFAQMLLEYPIEAPTAWGIR